MVDREDSAVAFKRLQWFCTHRSMREMDVLLGGFLDRCYASLPPLQAAAFAKLAELEDGELWPLISGKKAAADLQQEAVLQLIREARIK